MPAQRRDATFFNGDANWWVVSALASTHMPMRMAGGSWSAPNFDNCTCK